MAGEGLDMERDQRVQAEQHRGGAEHRLVGVLALGLDAEVARASS